jgi:peptidoglycan/LPS O-acetylase OafA/YrhL
MQYWVFFVLGCFLRDNPKWLSPIKGMRWYYLVYLMFSFADFYWSHVFLKLMVFFVANILLLFQVACDVNAYKGKGWGVLNWLGNESMGIYLWHVVSIVYIKFWWGTDDLLMFYVLQFLGVLVTIVTLRFFTRNALIHQYLMGVKKA